MQTDFVLYTRPGTRVTFVRAGIDIGLVDLRVQFKAGLWCWGRELALESQVVACLEPGRYTLHLDRGPAYPPERMVFEVGTTPVKVVVPATP